MKNIKNLAATALVAVALISPALSFADTSVACGAIDPVTSQVRICGNGNPYTVTNAWGLTGEQSAPLRVKPGTTFTDAAGIPFLCPAFFTIDCYNLSSLDYYKTQARGIARAGVAQYAYWLTH